MDPFACLKELLELIAEYHKVNTAVRENRLNDREWTDWLQELSDIRENIVEHLCSLTTWLEKGGFIPQLPFELPQTPQKAV